MHPCEVGWFESRKEPPVGVESHCRLPGQGGTRDFSGVWSHAPHWFQSLGQRRAEGAVNLVSTFSELSGCVIPVASLASAPGHSLSCVPPPGPNRACHPEAQLPSDGGQDVDGAGTVTHT